jgi:hypothetical protein
LISFRKAQTAAVLQSLKAIFEATLTDPKRRILQYFKRMEPPSYDCARYWDWIRPWVDNEVATNTKNQSIPVYRAELELSIQVKSLIEQLEGESNLKEGDVIEYPNQPWPNLQGPCPYIIWEMTGQQDFDTRIRNDVGIGVQILFYECKVS